MQPHTKPFVLIVSGYSGAGKTTVLHALEDIGFFCSDNLPIVLVDSFFDAIKKRTHQYANFALGLDVRNGADLMQLVNALKHDGQERGIDVHILFLICNRQILQKRFSETRRNHPLALDINLDEALEKEQVLLKPLIDYADTILDTSHFTVHQLRNLTKDSFGYDRRVMIVSLISFGFKYGVPAESNFVFDVRALPNPYFVPELKKYAGTQEIIQTYLFGQPVVTEYLDKCIDFLRYSIEKSYQEGRCFLNIAIGCTGGRHRSVALVEKIALMTCPSVKFMIKHRDIERDNAYGPSS